MDVLDLQPYFEYFLTVAAVVTIIIGAMRYANKKLEQKIFEEIEQATKPINPNTNGGKSLADLHNKIDKLRDDFDWLLDKQLQMMKMQQTIDEMEKNGRAD